MQRRFRRTQPMAHAQPVVQGFDAAAAAASEHGARDLLPGTASASSASLVASGVSSVESCIRFNLEHERALFPVDDSSASRATPLPSNSFVHFLVEGRVLSVPKLIVVSRCQVLYTALTSRMRDRELEQLGMIRVEGARYIIFRTIVYFLYCGDLEFVIPVSAGGSNANGGGSAAGAQPSSGASSISSSARGVQRCSESGAAASSSSLDEDERREEERLSHLQLNTPGGGDDMADATLERSFSNSSGTSNGSKKHRNSFNPSPPEVGKPHHPSLDPDTPLPCDNPSLLPSFPVPLLHSNAVASTSTCVLDPLELLVAADRFQLTSLCKVIEIGLSRQVTPAVVCNFLHFAETYHLQMLENLCHVFAVEHWETLQSSYPEEYAKLSEATRTRIEERLFALAGSHRGPQSRNEKNPLELPPPVTAPVGLSAAGGLGLDFSAASLAAGVQQMMGGVLQQFFGRVPTTSPELNRASRDLEVRRC